MTTTKQHLSYKIQLNLINLLAINNTLNCNLQSTSDNRLLPVFKRNVWLFAWCEIMRYSSFRDDVSLVFSTTLLVNFFPAKPKGIKFSKIQPTFLLGISYTLSICILDLYIPHLYHSKPLGFDKLEEKLQSPEKFLNSVTTQIDQFSR